MPKLHHIAAIAVAILSPFLAPGNREGAQAAQESVPAATVAKAGMTDLVSRVPVTGTIVAGDLIEVHSQIADLEILQVLVDIGQTVKTGDLLVRLDDSRLNAAKLQADAELARAQAAVESANNEISSAQSSQEEAEADQDRTQQLFTRGDTSQKALDLAISKKTIADANLASAHSALRSAQASLSEARANSDLAKLNLTRTNIRAHAGGLITERSANQGAIVGTVAGPLFRIIRDGKVEVEVSIFETALASISIGDRAELTVAGSQKITGKVRKVAPVVDQVTRLGNVWIAIDGGPDLRPGLSASGTITTNRHSGLTVPASAVQTDENGDFVQAVVDGVVKRRDVVTGVQSGNNREIVSGLENGETVLARSGAFFREGDEVRAIPVAAATGKDAGGASGSAQ